jgi:hypothetical protein
VLAAEGGTALVETETGLTEIEMCTRRRTIERRNRKCTQSFSGMMEERASVEADG